MFEIMTAQQAAALVRDGDTICVNGFGWLANPQQLHEALGQRVEATGHPRDLTILSPAGYGCWTETGMAECYVHQGAVRRVFGSHFVSMPTSTRLIAENQIEGYALPMGVLSHWVRAAAGGEDGLLTKVGLDIFVDPRLEGPSMNARSQEQIVEVVQVDGEDHLYYHLPKPDVAFLRATSVDGNGNITNERETANMDELWVAQAVKANGGRVIVQVERVIAAADPRDVTIPGTLVDAVVVIDKPEPPEDEKTLYGERRVPQAQLSYWADLVNAHSVKKEKQGSADARIIADRAAQELSAGDYVNIGVGIPEQVGVSAAASGMLRSLTLCVEAGGIGGLPVAGELFGATVGPDMLLDMSKQFDHFNSGGLDVCFMGAVELDKAGNICVHRIGDSFVGVGGFANITRSTKKVVFCLKFRTGGLKVQQDEDGSVHILKEGKVSKLVEKATSVSFSAQQALKNGQQVLYVTERCVFELTEKGIRLKEVYPGVDRQRDVLDQIPFQLAD